MLTRVALLALLLAGCARPAPEAVPAYPEASPPAPRADTAAAVGYLVKHQSADGAWRSDVYAAFKDGTALTPLVVGALQDAAAAPAARAKALAFLDTFVKDGEVREPDGGFDYPVYTAALALKALCHADGAGRAAAKAAWTKYLLDRQLTTELGWAADDPHYGGWGYCRVIPKKPEPTAFAPPLTESNLSATLFALEALHAAGALTDARAAAAVAFVCRCQNADGGFHFVHADPVRNKAGLIDGVAVSYGSATADGLRALRLCGRGADARATRAADWLRTNFAADRHPGAYPPQMEANRNAVYFYYAASAAKALPDAPGLAAALARRQRPDGSWANAVELVRENDPLVATSQALAALAALRGPGR